MTIINMEIEIIVNCLNIVQRLENDEQRTVHILETQPEQTIATIVEIESITRNIRFLQNVNVQLFTLLERECGSNIDWIKLLRSKGGR